MNTSYQYRYRIVIMVFLSFLAINIACRYTGLLDGHYSLRKWLWYGLGLCTFAIILFRKNVLNLFKGVNHKEKAKPIYLLCLIGSVFLIGLMNVTLFPRVSIADKENYLKQDYASFEQVRQLTDSLFLRGKVHDKYTFNYMGKRFEIQRDSGSTREYNGAWVSTMAENKISRLMYRNELRTITIVHDKITYFFNGYDADCLFRLKGSLPDPEWKRIDSVYFIDYGGQ